MNQTDTVQFNLLHGFLNWANAIWGQFQEAKIIESESLNETLSLENNNIISNITTADIKLLDVIGVSACINKWTEILAIKLISLTKNENNLINDKFCIPYQSILFLFIAVMLIVMGSFISIQSIPTTALPPTNIHSLFDATDKDIKHECTIINNTGDIKENDTENDKNTDTNPLTSLNSNHLTEWHAIIMPITAGLTLFILYKLFHRGKLNYATTILRYNMILINFVSTMGVTSFLIRFALRHLCHWFHINSLLLAPRYRISIVDDNKDIHCMGQSPYVSNFKYVDSITGRLGYENIIKYLSKPSNRLMRQEYYYREFNNPGDINHKQQISNIYIDWIWIFSSVIGVSSSAMFYFFPSNWLILNLISFNITIWSISQINLKNLKTGILILLSLFLYDIFFVFHTDMMVTVAQNLELPVKILLPTDINKDTGTAVSENAMKFSFSLLGTGDVVLPGFFISLCYKYDIWRWHNLHEDEEFHLLRLPGYVGRYFVSSLMGYILGLLTCMIFLHWYQVGQPALLYIVPSVIITVLSVAYLSGDISEFWNFRYDVIDYMAVESSSGEIHHRPENADSLSGEESLGEEDSQLELLLEHESAADSESESEDPDYVGE